MTDTLMINTHLITQEFAFQRATSVAEALSWLARHGEETHVLAGGTDLLVQMKLERVTVTHILYIGRLEELRQIREDEGVTLGALVSVYDLQRTSRIREHYTALYEAARAFTGTQIKVMASLGGNLCNASPAADSAPPLLVFDARVVLRTARGERSVPIADFFLGPGKTVRTPDELLVAVQLPPPAEGEGSAFLKIGRVGADIAKVNVAARLVRDGDRIADCRIALGAVAPTPLRARQAESALIGKPFTRSSLEEAAHLAATETAPITDIRSTATYRLQVARVLVRDALSMAWE
ncbi:MAG: xanthine dehydrogenase family protein subunit M, partial [Nitrospinota bacterium]